MASHAKVCGVLLLVSLIAGGFGESYVPARMIVAGDAVATVDRFRQLGTLMRQGFAAYLVEAICDVALAMIFYLLLRPVRRDLALLAAFYGLVGTAIYAVAELFFAGVTPLVSGAAFASAFTPGQLGGVVLLWLKVYGYGAVVSIPFYGLATLLRGYLIFRSGFLPAWIGALLMLGGLAFVVRAVVFVLAPSWPAGSLLFLMGPGGIALTVWLLVRGVDAEKWVSRAAAAEAS